MNDAFLNQYFGILEGGIHIAAGNRPMERYVVFNAVVHLRSSGLGRLFRINHYGKWFVVDLNQIQGVRRLIWILGHDRSDDIADITNDVLCDGWIGRDLEVRVRDQPGARCGLQRAFRIGTRVNGQDAGSLLRLRGVDSFDPCVGMRTAQHHQMHHSRKNEIVGVACCSGDEPGIFPPSNS